MKNINWSKWGTWLAIIGILISALFFYYGNQSPNLEFRILSKTKILSVTENISNLSIKYDGKDLSKSNENITTYVLRIINAGGKPIFKNYFDKDLLYGINIGDANLIQRPEIIGTSDVQYFLNSLDTFSKNKVFFKELIYNPGDYFDLKLLVLHQNDIFPNIESFGKIANQNRIEILPLKNDTKLIFSNSEEDDIKIWLGILGLSTAMLVFILKSFSSLLSSLKKIRINLEDKLDKES